jgi:hypothetical protein
MPRRSGLRGAAGSVAFAAHGGTALTFTVRRDGLSDASDILSGGKLLRAGIAAHIAASARAIAFYVSRSGHPLDRVAAF